MFSRPAHRIFRLAVLCIWLAACSKQPPAARKIAVAPFENLSADPRLDWMSSGFSEIVAAQLTGSSTVDPVSVRSLRDAPSSGAGGVLQGYFSIVRGGLRVEAVLTDSATGRTLKTASATGAREGIFDAAASLAKQIDPNARAFSTRNPEALRAWLDGTGAGDAAGGYFARAIAADPDFGAAYVSWTQWLAARGGREKAKQAIDSARERGTRIGAVERARLGVLAAAIQGDRAAERKALVELVRATPADASLYRTLANMDLAARRYADAARWYDEALARDPENAALLNEAGYAHAYARDLEGAKRALTRYQKLRPREANPLDSIGDVHFYLGRFAEAEKYYLDAYAKAPSFLLGAELHKAAWARLMAGDVQGARKTFARFVEARRQFGDPAASYRAAQWDYLTGRRNEAVAALEKVAQATGSPITALAALQLSVWALESGDRERAREFALRAGPSNPIAALCRFIAGAPASPAEWSARADQAFPNPVQAGARRYALAYALLLSKEFAAAVPRLTEIYKQTTPSSPDPVEVLLAWALVETGRLKEAGELLSVNPVPEPTGEHLLLSLSFPRILELRARALAKGGAR